MKKKLFNNCHIEGLLYQHTLEAKISGPNSKNPNTTYITGTVEIATDDACLNIVPVHYTYVTATTSTGKTNNTYNILADIVAGIHKTVMKDGAENAAKVKIDTSIGLNEFYSDRNGKEELVSAKRNEGGFIHIVNELDPDEKVRSTFDLDIILTKATRLDADEERQIPEKVIIHGVVFDFRKNILPVDLSVTNPIAMDYFEGLDISDSNPVFTRVKGRQISETVVKTIREASAFGDDYVREVKNSRKDFVVTWAAAEPYIWDDESTILVSELNEAIANREVALAEIKTRNDEYKASKNGTNAPSAFAAPTVGKFNF